LIWAVVENKRRVLYSNILYSKSCGKPSPNQYQTHTMSNLSPIASPLAGSKLSKRIYKLTKRGKKYFI